MSVNLPRRRLGTLEVSAIGLGCMGMSEFYGPANEATSLEVINHALDIGIDLLDTADVYGRGANERLLSKILKTRRDEVVLATKFGNMRDAQGRFVGINGRPEYVIGACDASLSRLGVEQIDLYYQHRVDPNVPIEETVGAMARLVTAGKVRHLGLSEASANTLRRASTVHAITALQSEYSLWTREIEQDVLPVCRELGVGFVAYSPLGRGFLTGTIRSAGDLGEDDWRRQNPRFESQNMKHNQRLLAAIEPIASSSGCSPAQFALAWLLHQGEDIVPIPGTRQLARLDENAAAIHLPLSDEALQRIDAALANLRIAGTRYPAAGMANLNR